MTKELFILSFLFIVFFSFSQNVSVEVFATGFNNPVHIQNVGDDRLFIVEQDGIIKILNADGNTNPTAFLNINPIVGSGGDEQGLLGLAFHPDYLTNGYFFVNYTNNSGNTVIARYSVSGNPNIADSGSGQIILPINQTNSNHNGGSIVFGPDNYLYIGMGDGGGAGDTSNNAQNGNLLLGKMLRIDVGVGTNADYTIPADNPFVGDATVLDEVWAIGVRNPWKFTFDKMNGDLWIADVGQYDLEEINHTPNGNSGGLNYGWRCYEGNSTFNTSNCANISNYEFPVAEYTHTTSPFRCSISGGYVYRGSLYPNFSGLYFFADYCSNEIGTIDPSNGNQLTFNGPFSGGISSFGQDINGELYYTGLSNGIIYKIKDATLGTEDYSFTNDISINPNPAKKNIFIKSESGNFKIESIQAFNVIGSKVLEVNTNSVAHYQLDLKKLTKGVYFLKIQLNNQEAVVKKLIIK